ncbi:MAG TPA: hypothetical protein DCL35_03470 [Candidatus Omnitrophica bacterium]|nr:hypothetical protein [Candidatus Omnitrophota bacterium]
MKNIKDKIKLFEGLLTREIAKTGPNYVDLDVTRRCNLTCLGCCFHSPYVEDAKQRYQEGADIDPGLVRRVVPELKKAGCQLIVIQGAGEPLIHPGIVEIASIIKKAGLRLIIITNGLLLDEDKATAFIDMSVDALKVTMWASSPEQYRLQYPGSDESNLGLFLDRLKAVKELKAQRKSRLPNVCLHHPINRNNFRTIDRFVDLALSTGCDSLSFSQFSPVWQSLAPFALSREEEKEVVATLCRVRKRLDSLTVPHNIDNALLRYRLGQNVWQNLPCYIMWFHARIRSDGAVQACGRSELTFGNLHQMSFSQVWNSPSIRRFRRQAMSCRTLSGLRKSCDCDYCCFARDNMRIHRIFKWFAPFSQ